MIELWCFRYGDTYSHARRAKDGACSFLATRQSPGNDLGARYEYLPIQYLARMAGMPGQLATMAGIPPAVPLDAAMPILELFSRRSWKYGKAMDQRSQSGDALESNVAREIS